MAQIIFDIGDATLAKYIEACNDIQGRTGTDENGNPVEYYTPAQWAKKQLIDHAKEIISRYESKVRDQQKQTDVAAIVDGLEIS